MEIAMEPAEQALLESFLRSSDRFMEFGSGGSTCRAAELVARSVVSVDSAPEWIARVRDACADMGSHIVPRLVHADIGATRKWGYPVDPSKDWSRYHDGVWDEEGAANADLYLVDGRFRVACVMQIILRADKRSIIGVHDYASRSFYHVIGAAAREIARTEDLSFFAIRPAATRIARRLLRTYDRIPE